MTNPNKIKGDRAERAVRAHLRGNGFPHAERTRAGYERDGGDLHLAPVLGAGPGVIAQVKDCGQSRWAEWLTQTEEQLVAARAEHAVLIVKRRGIGDPGRWLAVMPLHRMLELLRHAGYGPRSTEETTGNEATYGQATPPSR
ncbi:hypothetical protein QT969_20800 [Rhodococcus sp. CSLK01-03]|uniref:Holliday junction resolvase n=1 Tax=Rhodococcus indonesiensis TaxID=3055869 RepID=A0ABT7RSW2_9NOCA|nr:hypothetical protein [Rhodococcus indonesiensis]MDM7490730.1 hypothetical protein [Rhodococcus indonesiensis]